MNKYIVGLKSVVAKFLPEWCFNRITKNEWKVDNGRVFLVDQKTVASFFNKTQSLMFSKKSALSEEKTILPLITVNEKSRVLDLGCGDGRWGKILIPKCKEYVGIDISQEFIGKAQQENRGNSQVRFYCFPVQEYLSNDKYDLILLIGLITYMNDEDIIKMANNCRKMLANGGKLVLRSIPIEDVGIKRKVYFRKPNFIMRLLGVNDYQIIRRSVDEELRLFNLFDLDNCLSIDETGYKVYIFK